MVNRVIVVIIMKVHLCWYLVEIWIELNFWFLSKVSQQSTHSYRVAGRLIYLFFMTKKIYDRASKGPSHWLGQDTRYFERGKEAIHKLCNTLISHTEINSVSIMRPLNLMDGRVFELVLHNHSYITSCITSWSSASIICLNIYNCRHQLLL